MKLTKDQAIDKLHSVPVNTLTEKTSLYYLCEIIGVAQRIIYFCMKPDPREKKSPANYPPIKKITDFGLVFNDGFRIRHIERWVFAIYDNVDTIKIQERE